MNSSNKLRCLALASLSILILGGPTAALDPNQPPSSFIRTHFTADEGLPGGVVDLIAQTRDGFLWFISNANFLNRFDGKNFYDFKSPRATTLAVAPDGDLWAGTDDGLVRIPSSSFNQFTLSGLATYHPGPDKASQITVLFFSKNGTLWVGTAAGLFRFEREQFVAVGPRGLIQRIKEAPDGHLLVIDNQGFTELAGSEVVPHPQLAAQLGVKENEIYDVLKDSHDNTWYCTPLGVARESAGQFDRVAYGPKERGAFRAYEDSRGAVWIVKDEGLFRSTSTGLESVADKMQVRSLYEDRDGNLWVGTNGDGLYRFKERAVRMFTRDDGLPNNLLMTAVATHDGAVWTGANCGGISRFDGKHFQTYNEKNGLLNSCVWGLAEDANHDLWIGTWGGGAFHYHNGTFTQYPKGQGLISDRVLSIVAARDGSVWFGTPEGISRFRNGQFRNYTTADGLANNLTYRVFEDRAGVIWAGTKLGLYRLMGDRFENLASVPKSVVLPIGQDRDGGLFVYIQDESTSLRFYDGHVDKFTESAATAMVETEQGDIWFDGGIVHRFPPHAFTQARSHDDPLDYEPFATADGLPAGGVPGPMVTLALTRDSKLWAATPNGLVVFDLNRLPITNTKPSVYMTYVTIGRDKQRAGHEVVLLPGMNHLQIDFAAVEISSPEKIRMQYRLDGVDSEWLDAPPNDPHAIYSNIPIGTHALHIRTCNRNGIWDRQGVIFNITQKPYFYQTRWFVAAMVALGIMLVVVIYRLRVAQISRMLSARFDERLAERTRVAREIHDTLLQTVQGSKMVADHALKNSADHSRMVRAMEQLATWLAQATEEGRAALLSLRSSTTEKNDLAQAFQRAIDECGTASKAEVSFSVNGDAREMHPVVRDEVYRIGYEAIRNSCAHSGAGRLAVTLEYAHDLTLHISDNGVGIDSEVLEKGKDGHFGLRGMRERAERIGGKLSMASSPDSGTVITLIVPGRIAFHTGA